MPKHVGSMEFEVFRVDEKSETVSDLAACYFCGLDCNTISPVVVVLIFDNMAFAHTRCLAERKDTNDG